MLETWMPRALPPVGLPAPWAQLETAQDVEARQLALMTSAFDLHGGILGGETVAECLRWKGPHAISKLAQWIATRSIVTLVRHGRTLIPMFQFQLADLSVKPSFSRVFNEFNDTFDDWEVACWFATPNSWLDERTPVDCLRESEHDVVQAARADRFIARG